MKTPTVCPRLLRPLATSKIVLKISQPTSSILASPVAIRPALISIKSAQCSDKECRVDTFRTGAAARPYGVPLPVVNTCKFMPAASCRVPHTKSLAGVAANSRPFCFALSPGPSTPEMGLVPDFATEPNAFPPHWIIRLFIAW